MGRYGDLNYERLTKLGFLASLSLLVIGAGGELTAAATHTTLPAWENTLFTDLEIVGTLGILLCPFVFGILLPLTE